MQLGSTNNMRSGVPIFVEHWGDNLQFYPNFALFSTLGGMNLDHDFVQVSKLSKNQKKTKFFTTNETLFSPNSSGQLRSNAHQSQIIGGNADVDHSETIRGHTAKLLGGYIPLSPPGFGIPACDNLHFCLFVFG